MSFVNATLKPEPFTIAIPDESLTELRSLIRSSKLAPPTYESADSKFGLSHAWLKNAREYWATTFDWRKHETRINSFPNFTVPVKDDDGHVYNIHYIGVISPNPNAIPIVLLHGWPGSFLEFLDTIPILAASTDPSFHIIVPSLIGFGFSSPPPLDRDFGGVDLARLIDKMMVGLGFGSGYVVQGGDLGSLVGRIIGASAPACKAIHLTFNPQKPPADFDPTQLTESEKQGLERGQQWWTVGNAYALEHATRPSTIGHVLASNPVALLAWIGEKFLEWSDEDPSLDNILESVTLYWLTETFPTSIYVYRHVGITPGTVNISDAPEYYIPKPLGYSYFPKESMPIPASWVATTGNLVFSRVHDRGGHFAALECPALLADDLIMFARQIKADAFPVLT